jgi:hypothetical protein
MPEQIAVVKPHYAKEEAYNDGYERFEAMDIEESEDFDLAPFQDSATYANHVLPNLRAMAGFGDSGHGTHTENRKVAAIKPGCEEDEPAEAELLASRHLIDELTNAWTAGAHDAALGREKHHSLDDV